jgi:Alkylmercury lyase
MRSVGSHGFVVSPVRGKVFRMSDGALIQVAFTKIMKHFVATGRAPHYTELADSLDLDLDTARDLLRATVAAAPTESAWLAHDTDHIESWSPFSNVPTHILISVDGVQKWYGQCGLQSLGVRWLFPDQEVSVETPCLDCGNPVRVRMRNDTILEVDPGSAVGYQPSPWARSRTGSTAFN